MWLASYRGRWCPHNYSCLLTFHDGAGTECFIKLQITSKRRYSRNGDDHSVLLAVSSCTNNALNHSRTNLVLDRLLLIARGSDEKLILDVDEVLAVSDDLTVRILNRVLQRIVSSGRFSFDARFTDLSADKIVAPFG